MANGKVTFSRSIRSVVNRRLDKIDRAVIDELKNDWLADVKRNVRAGKTGDGKSRMPQVTEKWRKRRARLYQAGNPMGKGMTPNARISRATFMGDTLKGLRVRYSTKEWREDRRIKFTMYVEGRHRPVIGVRGKVLAGSTAKLSDILKGLEDNGYQVLGWSQVFRNKFYRKAKKMFK